MISEDDVKDILDLMYQHYNLGVPRPPAGYQPATDEKLINQLTELINERISANVQSGTVGDGLPQEPGQPQPQQGSNRIRSRVD